MAGEAEVGQERGRGGQRDPLRPSALRVVLLLLGAAYCLLAFGVAFAGGLWPIFWRSHVRREYLDRAAAQDPTIDFASPDWIENSMWSAPDLPGQALVGDAGEVVLVLLVMAPVVFAAAHILVTWLAAGLALRADRRLDLKLGERPALSLAAAVMVRVLFTWTPLLCAVCGLAAGFSYLGAAQNNLLSAYRLEWVPLTGVALAIIAVLVGDVLISVSAVRNSLQRIAPVQSRLCNGCGYSLRGLPTSAEKCPECGRALLGNRTIVSLAVAPRVWRGLKWAIAVLLVVCAASLAVLVAYEPTARLIARQWVKASPAFGVAGIAYVQAKKGAILKVTDGTKSAFFAADWVQTPGEGPGWSMRARGIEFAVAGGTVQRREIAIPIRGSTAPAAFLTSPAWVHGLHPMRPGEFFAIVQVSPPVAGLSVTFAKDGELPAEDAAWLREHLVQTVLPGDKPVVDPGP